MSVGWINKLCCRQTMGYYFNNHSGRKKEGNLDLYYSVAEVSKDYMQYDSNYATLWKRQNYGDIKKVTGC